MTKEMGSWANSSPSNPFKELFRESTVLHHPNSNRTQYFICNVYLKLHVMTIVLITFFSNTGCND